MNRRSFVGFLGGLFAAPVAIGAGSAIADTIQPKPLNIEEWVEDKVLHIRITTDTDTDLGVYFRKGTSSGKHHMFVPMTTPTIVGADNSLELQRKTIAARVADGSMYGTIVEHVCPKGTKTGTLLTAYPLHFDDLMLLVPVRLTATT